MIKRFFKNEYWIPIFLLAGIGCTGPKNVSQGINANAEFYQKYLLAYTSGWIGKDDPITIYFAKPVVDSGSIGKNIKINTIEFSPKLAGEWRWENPTLLKFYPKLEDIHVAQNYTYTIDLQGFFSDIQDGLRFISFAFQFKPTTLSVEWNVLKYDLQTENALKLEGTGVISDAYFDIKKIKEKFKVASKGGTTFPIKIIESESDPLRFTIQISPINRNAIQENLTIEYPYNLDESASVKNYSLIIPAKDEFVVLGIDELGLNEGKIGIFFSDPIGPGNNLRNIIQVKPETHPFSLDIQRDAVWINFDNKSAPIKGQISISSDVKNEKGKTLSKAFTYDFTSESEKPQVKFLSKGSILPFQQNVIIPFEAINLQAIDVEVFKIYSNNVLYALHFDFGEYDNYYLTRLGKVIHQQKLDLTYPNNSKSWQRYSLDVSKMVETEPGAFYEIRLVFKPEYTQYPCEKVLNLNLKNALIESGTDEFTSIWNQWAAYDYSSDEKQNYDETDPCNASYYYSAHYARTQILASNIALSAKMANDGKECFAAVNDINSGMPVKGASVQFYDGQMQLMISVKTDGNGVVIPLLNSRPSIILAQKDNHFAYLKLHENQSLSISEFDVSGTKVENGLKTSLYTERGIYRPGDSINFQAILYQIHTNLPTEFPVQLKLFNPRKQLVFDQKSSQHMLGLYSFTIPTKVSDITGVYRAVFSAGGIEFYKNILVETVKPNRFVVKLNLKEQMHFEVGQKQIIKVQANWLHGAPASNKNLTVDIKYNVSAPDFTSFKTYQFVNPEWSNFKGETRIYEGLLDENGAQNISINSLPQYPQTGILKSTWISNVMDSGGEISTDYFNNTILPHDVFVGVSISESNIGRKVDAGTHQIKVVSLDKNEKGVSSRNLEVSLYSVVNDWWYEIRQRNNSGFQYDNFKKILATKKVTTDQNGRGEIGFDVEEYTRYFVQVRDVKSNYVTGEYFHTGWSFMEDENSRQFASILPFTSDKSTYNIHEKVKLELPGSKGGNYLISIMRGNKILKHYQTKASENKTAFEFEATEEMSPNVYVDVSFIQARQNVRSDLPLRLYGVIPVKVEDPDRKLNPQLKMNDEIKPNQEFQIEVSETKGKDMVYHLFIVDEGLLNLTRFKTPNPYDDIFSKEALNVMSWDNYNDIIGNLDAATERVISIGGDAAASSGGDKKNQRFKPVVLKSGPIYLKPNEKKNHKFTVSNYIGEVRVMLVANNQSSFGSAEKNVKVKQDLMATMTLPRVLNTGDEMDLPVTVFTGNDNIKNVQIKLKTGGGATIVGPSSNSLEFSKQGEKMTKFRIKALNKIGNGEVEVIASAGNISSSEKIQFYVDNPNPVRHETIEYWIEKNKTVTGNPIPFGMEGSRKVVLQVSSIPELNLDRMVKQLINYPHGCVEQTTSAAFPQIYLGKLLDLTQKQQDEALFNISSAIQKLQRFQNSDGSMSYWPGNSSTDDWASTYVYHFLIEAKSMGFAVPETTLQALFKYQRRAAMEYHSSSDGRYHWKNIDQAYRLYTLALAGKPEWSAMNKLMGEKDISFMSKWLLAGGYALSGKQDVAEKLTKNLNFTVNDYREYSYSYGSHNRDEALICMILVHRNKTSEAYKLMIELLKKYKNNGYWSTQELSMTLASLYKLVGAAQAKNNIQFSYSWNGAQQQVNSNKQFYQIDLNAATNQKLSLTNQSELPLLFTLIQYGKAELEKSSQEMKGLQLSCTINNVDYANFQNANNVIQQGKELVLTCHVNNSQAIHDFKNIALTIPVPAGFEIVNRRIGGIVSENEKSFDYQDIRDDRVYTYFNLPRGAATAVEINLIASYTGTFLFPEITAEVMYDPSVYARLKAGKITIQAK